MIHCFMIVIVIILPEDVFLYTANESIVRMNKKSGKSGGEICHELVGNYSQRVLHWIGKFSVMMFLKYKQCFAKHNVI